MQLYSFLVGQVELKHLVASTVHSCRQGPVAGMCNSNWRRQSIVHLLGDRKNLRKHTWLVIDLKDWSILSSLTEQVSLSARTNFCQRQWHSLYSPPGFKATATFLSTPTPVNRARVPGIANDDVEKIIGITPELFTCSTITPSKIN